MLGLQPRSNVKLKQRRNQRISLRRQHKKPSQTKAQLRQRQQKQYQTKLLTINYHQT